MVVNQVQAAEPDLAYFLYENNFYNYIYYLHTYNLK